MNALINKLYRLKARQAKRRADSQKGFTLVELIIVLAIVALLAIFGIPLFQSYLMEGRVEPTAQDLSKLAAKIRGNYAAGGTYDGLSTATASKIANGLATSLVVGTSTMSHDLGGTGSVSVAGSGSAFTITLGTVNNVACPGPANVLSRSADSISVNGTAAKSSGGTYNAGTASGACTDGDSNSIVVGFK